MTMYSFVANKKKGNRKEKKKDILKNFSHNDVAVYHMICSKEFLKCCSMMDDRNYAKQRLVNFPQKYKYLFGENGQLRPFCPQIMQPCI